MDNIPVDSLDFVNVILELVRRSIMALLELVTAITITLAL